MADFKDSISLEIQSSTKTADNGISKLVNDLKQLHNGMNVGTSSINNISKQFKELGINLSGSKLKSSISSINSDLLRYVTTNGQVVIINRKVKNGLESYKISLKSLNQEMKKGTSIWSAFTQGISGAIVKLQIIYNTLMRVATKLGDIVNEAAKYEESLNLFTASLGDQAEEATAWVTKFSNALYLDPANVMQYMGSFKSLISGLGVGADDAYLMSQNLTQLTYDLASFKNMKFEEAFNKLQSAISGEIEPLRNVGVALSQNTLQELANSMGIKERVAEMSEAEKAQLRYIQILKSTSTWQGDMGRTLVTPANAIRVLREQFTLLSRAVGSIFIPLIMVAVPYVVALSQVLTDLANRLAAFFGYEIEDIDYSNIGNITDGLEGIGDAADDTTEKLNTMLAPFDELNVVQNKSKSNGLGGNLGGGDLGADLPSYNALADLTDKMDKNVAKAKENLNFILKAVTAIGLAFATWKIAKSVITFIDTWKKFGLDNLRKTFGLSLIIGSVVWDMKTLKDLYDPNSTDDQFTKALLQNLGTTIGVFGGSLIMTKSITLSLAITAVKLTFDIGIGIKEIIEQEPTFKELMWAVEMTLQDAFKLVGKIPISFTFGGALGLLIGELVGFDVTIGDIFDGLYKISDSINTTLTKTFTDIGNAVGKFVYDTVEWFKKLPGRIETELNNLKKKATKKFNEIKTEATKKFNEIKTNATNSINNIITTITGLPGKISKGLKSIPEKFGEAFNKAKNKVKEIWGNITGIFSKGGKIFNGLKEGIADTFKTIVNNLITGINKIIKAPFDKINKLLNDIRNINILGAKPFERLWGKNPLPIPQIPKLYAEGGYPQTGELFIAREAGAEMVGKIGNQTAVANNDQITTALTNALITAFNNYNFGNNKPGTTIVNIGGRKVYEGIGDYVDSENDRYGTNYVHV